MYLSGVWIRGAACGCTGLACVCNGVACGCTGAAVTYCVTVLFTTHIRSTWTKPTSSATYATDQNVV